ncbi:MAG: TonB-dependent receptor [Flavobacteriales bacterium]|nr:TonB-dependent receptor [Flavobacteriales bacterium]
MKRFIFFSAMFIFAVPMDGQGLHGYVFGEDSDGMKTTLAGAVVVWEGTRSGTVCDENGFYSIGLAPGSSKLVAGFIGYVSDTILYEGQAEVNFVLKESATLNAVQITEEVGSTTINMLNPQAFQVLNEKELCKAACCNLSESFETNASVDAAYADAITGTRQIRMLGLEGKYTQMLFDNVPASRGLASTYGLTYIPGPWVKNIYISKGAGSVTAGYESISGQINVAVKSPANAEKFQLNAYAGSSGRTELNLIYNPHHEDSTEHVHRVTFRPVFLAHGAMSQFRSDMNRDGFLDNPLFANVLLRNEWHLSTQSGISGQYVLGFIYLNGQSGQFDFNPADDIRAKLWGTDLQTRRYEFVGKTGYVFRDKPWKSFGSQVTMQWHDQSGRFGYRNYLGQQLSGRMNLLFATRIFSDAHKITTGTSFNYDDYTEGITYTDFPPLPLSSLQLGRMEQVIGVFSEYTWNHQEDFTLVAGLRSDYHNYYGLFFTPRLHARYSFNPRNSLKLVAGKGYRTANLLMDNVGVLAGNRNIIIEGNNENGIYGLDMEEATNVGLIWSLKRKINHRDASMSIDVYHTQFQKQVVLDMETPTIARFYNLSGNSYSTSAQVEIQWSPVRRLECRMAYRWLDAKTTYDSLLLERPLLNKHRAFINLAFATKEKSNGAHWRFDATAQWISQKRIPFTGDIHGGHEGHAVDPASTYSNDYFQLNAQVTYAFKKDLEIYVGGENLTNFMIHDAIISADDPSSAFFDGSMVWGPVFGRMGYVGFRWLIK